MKRKLAYLILYQDLIAKLEQYFANDEYVVMIMDYEIHRKVIIKGITLLNPDTKLAYAISKGQMEINVKITERHTIDDLQVYKKININKLLNL